MQLYNLGFSSALLDNKFPYLETNEKEIHSLNNRKAEDQDRQKQIYANLWRSIHKVVVMLKAKGII
jgi:fructose-1-phosphate kinase PfkB-like protein